MKFKGLQIVILISTIPLLIVNCNRVDSRWKGKIENVGGVVTVKNPKKPMFEEKDEAFIIQEDLSIGVKEGLPEYMFSLLRDIDVDEDGNIYALDFRETKVKVFDSHGVYIRTIGQRGQGPGEFVSAYVLSVTPQKHLFVTDVAGRRISIFELSGEFIRAISTAETLVLFPTLDSKECIYDLIPGRGENTGYELRKYSQDLKNQRILMTSPSVLTPQKKQRLFPAMIRFDLGPDDSLIYGYSEEYLIKICDSEGKILRHITKEYDPVPISHEEREEVEKRSPAEGYRYDIPQYHSAYRLILVDDKGWIFVGTFERDEKGYIYDIFTPEGKYFAKVDLAFPPVVMKKNKLYSIESDEEGYNIIKRYEYSFVPIK